MNIKITQKQLQKTILAPSMQQSIEVLLLPLAELSKTIEQELQENPLLEAENIDNPESKDDNLEILSKTLSFLTDSQRPIPSYSNTNPDDEERANKFQIAKKDTLEDYLLEQLHFEISDPDLLKIGEFIIGDLDNDGFLKSSIEEIQEHLKIKNMEDISAVLEAIQSFDPLGIASRNIRECLLIQAKFMIDHDLDLIVHIITEHFEDLGKKRFNDIAHALHIPVDKVKELSKTISSLEPKPARNHRPIADNIYVKPDVTIKQKNEDEYEVIINNDSIPPLRINNFYKDMLKKPNCTKEETDFIKEKINNAILFIKSIDQRQSTLRDISLHILNHQKSFFEFGYTSIKPLILKDVAEAIERNESTVCRAINNKYIDTPQGLYPMKFFFSQSIPNQENGAVSSRRIKEELKNLISDEDKTKPLSDHDIQTYFNNKGINVARRTISKYRQALNILPSNLRKE